MSLDIGEFLLGMAGLSATLFGAFLIGVFFYIDSELHRQLSASKSTDVYLRSGMRGSSPLTRCRCLRHSLS